MELNSISIYYPQLYSLPNINIYGRYLKKNCETINNIDYVKIFQQTRNNKRQSGALDAYVFGIKITCSIIKADHKFVLDLIILFQCRRTILAHQIGQEI